MRYDYKRIILWILVIGWMLVIFAFSSQDGEESAELSGGITEAVVEILVEDFHEMPSDEQMGIMDKASFIVRKLAHFTEYGVLGFLLFLLVRSYGKRGYFGFFVPLAAGAAYALTDEFHQTFSEGRSPKAFDVCIDSAGVFFGILFGLIVLFAAALIDKRTKKGIL